jgi:hypothetical protein
MWDGFDLPGARRHEMRGFGETPLPPIGEYSHADDLTQAIAGEQGDFRVAAQLSARFWTASEAPAEVHARIVDMHERAEIPDAEHAVIEGAGHLPALERPEATAGLVRKFLGPTGSARGVCA